MHGLVSAPRARIAALLGTGSGLVPSFDLNFARLDNPVTKYGFTFTRATSATYVNASGLIATAASGELRYTYDPVTLSALGVLIEEQRTNLLLYSSAFDAATGYWGTTNAAAVSANTVQSPSGSTDAEDLVETAFAGSRLTCSRTSFTGGGTGAHTLSFYVKRRPGSLVRHVRLLLGDAGLSNYAQAFINVDTGAVNSASAAGASPPTAVSGGARLLSGGWIRVWVAGTFATTVSYASLWSTDAAFATSYTGDTSSGFHIWGAQLEAGAFPTSYIPTTGTAATRNADVLSLTGAADVVASWFNKDAGTWLVERYGSPAAIASAVCVDDGAATNRILVRQDASRVPHFIVGSTADVAGSAVVAGSAFKTAAAYAANDVSVSIGGGAVSTDATVTLPAGMTTARIGSSSAGEYANGTISRIRYYNRRLPNATLQSLTA